MWKNGNVGEFQYEAKVFDIGSMFGIDEGRISKLFVVDGNGDTVISYDRGWGIKPKTAKARVALEEILNLYKSKATEKGR